MVIPEAAPLITRLMLHFSPDNIKNECVTWDFLIAFHLYNVPCLNLAPSTHLETLRSFVENEFFNVLVVDFLSRSFEIAIMKQIEQASCEN